jgi:hypothetical protein
MEKEIIKKAFESAEKEAQEKQVEFVKKIVQKYLEKIDSLSKKKEEVDEEIRLLKKDLDDLKAGRLDKIEERQKVDDKAREVALIIIHKIDREYVPLAPWRSPYEIVWNNSNVTYLTGPATFDAVSTGTPYTTTTGCMSSGVGDCTYTVTGITVSNFTSGAYRIGGKIINF